jgi:Rap1a immunity proteins
MSRHAQNERMNQMRLTVYGALLVLMITTANAAEDDTNSANYLLSYCKLTTEQAGSSASSALNVGRCMGIVQGISQMFQLLNEARAAGRVQLDPLLCTSIPAGITTQQLVDVVVKYGETFPELKTRPFTVLAMSAMRVAWPCKG